MSWRARRRLLVPNRRHRRTLIWLTIVLLGLNVAVIAYHGDPRLLLGLAGGKHGRAAAKELSPAAERTGARSTIWPKLPALVRTAHAQSRTVQVPYAAELPLPAAPAPPSTLSSAEVAAAAAAFVGPMPLLNPLAELRSPGAVQRAERVVLGAGRTSSGALLAVGVTAADTAAVLSALGQKINLRLLRPRDVFNLRFDASGALVAGELARGPLEQLVFRRTPKGFVAEREQIAVDTVLQEVTGEVRTSLWEALSAAGEDPRLAQQLVDIFAYEVDFYSEVQAGDKFRLLVEKRYAHGQFLGYGDTLAAELFCGREQHRAFLFKQDGHAEYYDEAGAAMRKQLMRMPLQYGAVTSRFGRRRHPILGYTRAHNGVDYGVPIGTPVWSVADGTVVRAGWHGGYGRLVEVLHGNGWLSQYAHLSRIAVRPGQRVRQRQTVGLVGMTGLATGPHLHYGLKHRGHYVNSLAQRFERASSLSGPQLAAFAAEVGRLMGELDKMQVAQEPLPASPAAHDQS